MRTKIRHKLGAVLFAAGAMLLALPASAAMAQDYEGDFESSTTVIVESPVEQGTSVTVQVAVTSDVEAAGQDGLVIKSAGFTSAQGVAPTGEVTLAIDGEVRTTEELGAGGQANAELSTDGLAVGEHTVTATYSGDDNYDGSSDSATFQVVDGSQGGVAPGDGDDVAPGAGADDEVVTGSTGDVLPGVGGVDAWLIGAGALLIVGGGALLLVRRRTGLA